MKPVQLLVAAILACASSGISEDEYLIRVTTVGYENQLDFEIEPDEEELHVVETLAQPGKPFLARAETGRVNSRAGRKIFTLSGRLCEIRDGQVVLEIKTVNAVDHGDIVPIGDGKEQKVLDESIVKAQVSIPFNKPVVIGGLENSSSSRRQLWLTKSGEESVSPAAGSKSTEVVDSRRSKSSHILLVTKHQPEED